MNILFIVGSRNKKSRNYKITEDIIQKLDKRFHIDIINPNTHRLIPCYGCTMCFSSGKCTIDEKLLDDSLEIKSKLKKADIIVFNTPVYAHMVSGDIKILIDRLSYWLHIFELRRKQAIILTTTDTSGAEYVNDYLEKIAINLGMSVILVKSFYKYLNHKQVYSMIDSIVKNINNQLQSPLEIKSSDSHESVFQYLKFVYSNDVNKSHEKSIWEKRNWLNLNSYQEVLDSEV